MKLSFNAHYAIPAIALALSLPLSAVRNPGVSFVGGMAGAGAAGYIASTVLLNDERKKANRAIARQQTELTTRESELSTRYKEATAELQRKLEKAIFNRDSAIENYKTVLAEASAQRAKLVTELRATISDELTRQFEAEYEAKYQQKTGDFNRREDEFYHAEGELCDQIEALNAVLEQNESYLREEFGKETGARVEQWAGRYKQLQGQIAQYGEVIQMASSEAMEEIQKKDLVIARLKGQVELLGAPRRYRGNSKDDQIADKVLEFFLKRSIGVEAEDWQRSYHQLKVLLFPKGGKLAELVALADELQVELGLYARPEISIERSLFCISCDTDAKEAAKAHIIDPPLSKLEAALNESIHVRVVAQSGSGKTVLLGNLINYLTQHVSSDYVLSDPKVTAPENWGNLTPHYYSRECLGHFFGLTETCLKRIDEAASSVKATGKIPAFEMQFHIIDELEFLYGLSEVSSNKDHNSKLFKINAKSMLKVGREHKMKLLFVTQSPLPSDLNLRKNDFENCSSIFLGSQISAGLNSTGDEGLLKDVSEGKIAQLKAEHRARMARGDKWIYLFFNPAFPEQAFMGKCPSPGHYAALLGADVPSKPISQSGVLGGVAPRTLSEGATVAAQTQQGFEQGTGEGTAEGAGYSSTASAPPAVPASTALESLLNQGTHCPSCGHHSSSYAKPTPNSKGNVSVKCKNKECDRKTFTWKVI